MRTSPDITTVPVRAFTITRAGGGSSATRRYYYDAHQRLCRTVEPETGATVQDYDGAGNVAWRASGLPVTGSSACDRELA
jgi:YD repeat-containing protein